MSNEPLVHYSSDFNDFFIYDSVSSNEFVISGIKPAYQMFIDAMGLPNKTMDAYIQGSDFQKHYETATRMVSQYISDVYNKTGLQNISKYNLLVIVATNNASTYVIKGEFVLRVINDFIKGSIKLAGITYDEFIRFVEKNTPYWKDSMIEMKQTIIQMDSNNIVEYLYLLDRYEIYDENFIKNIRDVVDIFIF